jgi:PAS domain S-box-containing protein
MEDPSGTNQELIKEISVLKQGIKKLEQSEAELKRAREEKRWNQDVAGRLAGEMALIAEIGRVVGSTLDINQVYERVATEARKLIPYDRLLVNRKVTQEGEFIVDYISGVDNPRRRMGDLYPSKGSATGVAMSTRAGILIQPDDAEEIKDLYPNLYETFKTGLRSTMSVPLISMGEVIGSLNFRSKKLKAYTEQDLRLAERIGMQVAGAIANARLFNDLSRTEESLRRSEVRFQELFQDAPVGYFEYDAQGRITRVNQTELDMLGYPLEEMIGQPPWKFIVEQEPARQQILAKLAGALEPFRGFERTYLRKDGTTFPVLIQDRLMKDEKGNITGIRCAIQDITDRKQTEEKLQHTLESLRKAFSTTIQVMVSAVETRDPYTAGHQIRSADLARAIATEMGLPQDKIDGIRMAGSIHDIGKLSIPAEILSKPTKLSELEFSLIKEHARQGYEILKDVESPWPLAEIVYQHHERMDGSGYPRNLKGDDILVEARILTVADVVEAMASHRPYRPGLGIDAALNEIGKNRGIFYDKTVADACLRLFREKGFKLEGA